MLLAFWGGSFCGDIPDHSSETPSTVVDVEKSRVSRELTRNYYDVSQNGKSLCFIFRAVTLSLFDTRWTWADYFLENVFTCRPWWSWANNWQSYGKWILKNIIFSPPNYCNSVNFGSKTTDFGGKRKWIKFSIISIKPYIMALKTRY